MNAPHEKKPAAEEGPVRRLTPDDTEGVLRIVALEELDAAALTRELARPDDYLWMGVDLPDGRLGAVHRSMRWGEHLLLKGVFVDEPLRGSGAALQLAFALRDTARAEGYAGLAAWVEPRKPEAALAHMLRLRATGPLLHRFDLPLPADVPYATEATARSHGRLQVAAATPPPLVADLLTSDEHEGVHWVHDRHRLVLSGFPAASVTDLGQVLAAAAPLAGAAGAHRVELPVPAADLPAAFHLASLKAHRLSRTPVRLGRTDFRGPRREPPRTRAEGAGPRMMPSEARTLSLQPDDERAHAELSRHGLDATRLRTLLEGLDDRPWRAWSDTVELVDEASGRSTAMAVHVPPHRPGRRLGALIVLHGAGGSGEQILPYFTALGDRLSLAVLAPTAQELGAPEHHLDVAGIFGSRFRMPRWDLTGQEFPHAALRWARTVLGADPDRCVLAGVSMGGLATWNLGMRYWHSLAAAVPLNGALSIWESFGPDRRTRALLPNALPLPLFVVHGAEDSRIPPRFDRESVATLREQGHGALEYVEVPDGAHGLDTLGLAEDSPLFRRLERWLSRARRAGLPLEIRHRADNDTHGRAHWVELGGIEPGARGEVHARWTAPGRAEIDVSGARRVTLHLRGDRLPVGGALSVTVNGEESTVVFTPDADTVRRTFRDTADAGLVAEQVVHLDVPPPSPTEPTETNEHARCRNADPI
ncbi:hypothetical protein [Streptomyces sp. NPDC088730]|uniref:hypothetical protein n=1 Tax=Streptomyces sp. NPDC088730 TaxID=3365877 RepID=UPI00381C6032